MRTGGRTTAFPDFRGPFDMADLIAIQEREALMLQGPLQCILLAGGLQPSPLAAGAGMPALRLFPDGERSVLDNWIMRIRELSPMREANDSSIEVRILFDKSRDALEAPCERGGLNLVFESESAAYRGPAGVVRDVAENVAADATILIAEANRWLTSSLAPMLVAHLERNADVTIGRHSDGSPSGLYFARRSALDLVNKRGFVDLKEQWLSLLLRAGLDVFVHTFECEGAFPLRTRTDCLALARRLDAAAPAPAPEPILAPANFSDHERWRAVSASAEIHPTARIFGSVVMPMAKVGANAVVARSVVAPGAEIHAESEIVDEIVRGDALLASKMSARTWETNQ